MEVSQGVVVVGHSHAGTVALSVVVELEAATPVYEQIRAQLAGYILTGALSLGRQLPTVRSLAADLGVAVNTVGKAYQALETDGLVHSRRRTGTVIVYERGGPDLSTIREIARLLAQRSAEAGLGDETVIALVREAIEATTAAAGVAAAGGSAAPGPEVTSAP